MPPVPSRLGRGVLRSLVFVQLLALLIVAVSVYELVRFGTEITPGAVAIVVSMLACSVVAMRATFRREEGTRGHRLVFMSAQSLAAMIPALGRESLVAFVAAGSILPDNPEFGPLFLVQMMGLEVVFAALVAAISALLAPLLLPPPASSTLRSPFASGLIGWAGGVGLAAVVVAGAYGVHFSHGQTPAARLRQLFADNDAIVQRVAAQHLASMDLSEHPRVRSALFDALTARSSVDRGWAAYVLVASGADDGRAMETLRGMLRSFAQASAAKSLVMLGAAAEPAVPELARILSETPGDVLEASVQRDAAETLAAIGPRASSAIPSLIDRAREQTFAELRFMAGQAIDRIEPGFARRCTMGFATMIDALVATNPKPLEIKPECLGKPAGLTAGS